jgi:hypothetical protein
MCILNSEFHIHQHRFSWAQKRQDATFLLGKLSVFYITLHKVSFFSYGNKLLTKNVVLLCVGYFLVIVEDMNMYVLTQFGLSNLQVIRWCLWC